MKRAIDIFSAVVIVTLLLIGLVYFSRIGWELLRDPTSELSKEIRGQAAWTIGLPISAIAAFAIVVLLPVTAGSPLEFKGLGFELKGPSCQVVLWIACFLGFVLAICAVQLVTKAP